MRQEDYFLLSFKKNIQFRELLKTPATKEMKNVDCMYSCRLLIHPSYNSLIATSLGVMNAEMPGKKEPVKIKG